MERYGLLAAFDNAEALLKAVREARDRGVGGLDAFTPFPVEGLPKLLELPTSRIPVYAFIGGGLGAFAILALQLYSTLIDYPIDVGGRPLDSWPAFAVAGFECAILGAALVAFFGMLVGNRLPQLYHPVFNATSFSFADENRFYLLVPAGAPDYEPQALRELFGGLGAVAIEDVLP